MYIINSHKKVKERERTELYLYWIGLILFMVDTLKSMRQVYYEQLIQ